MLAYLDTLEEEVYGLILFPYDGAAISTRRMLSGGHVGASTCYAS